jgi:hypothetical protein
MNLSILKTKILNLQEININIERFKNTIIII